MPKFYKYAALINSCLRISSNFCLSELKGFFLLLISAKHRRSFAAAVEKFKTLFPPPPLLHTHFPVTRGQQKNFSPLPVISLLSACHLSAPAQLYTLDAFLPRKYRQHFTQNSPDAWETTDHMVLVESEEGIPSCLRAIKSCSQCFGEAAWMQDKFRRGSGRSVDWASSKIGITRCFLCVRAVR